jgi:hypothetical protein
MDKMKCWIIPHGLQGANTLAYRADLKITKKIKSFQHDTWLVVPHGLVINCYDKNEGDKVNMGSEKIMSMDNSN